MRKIFIICFLMCVFAIPALSFGRVSAQQDGNVVVQTIPGPTVAEKILERTGKSWPWYVTRASGLIAAVALVVLMLSGIGQITGHTFRLLDPLTAWASHRALGIAFGVSVLVHMFSLLFDHFISIHILDLFIPWLSDYKPVTLWGVQLGSLYVALGVLAFYLVAIVIITSLVIVDKKPYIWKLIHLLSYLAILFVFVHAPYIGTDLAHGFFRVLWVVFGLIVGLASLARLWRAKTT